ncbi:transporter [Dyella humicola]|uniref:transporter n=1 Tax=Dyella humicola TaxID=2992126 RepID=UPI002256DD2C|nr:transporter [Dyella humicola]
MAMSPLFRTATVSLVALIWSVPVLAGGGGADPQATGSQGTSSARLGQSGPDWAGHPGTMSDAGMPAPLTPVPDAVQAATEFGETWTFPEMSDMHAWGAGHGRWSIASLASSAYATPLPPGVESDALGVNPTNANYAASFVPVVASYHISQTDRIAISLGMASTSHGYQYGRPNSTAMDVWSIRPRVAYTRVFPGSDVESSTVFAMGVFSQKSNAMYQNGFIGRFETMLMKRTSNGWAVGGVAAAIETPNSDPGSMPGRGANYEANNGLAMGVGPQVSWAHRWMGSNIELRSRWIYEFRGPNGHTDQPIMLTATLRP